MSGVGVIRAEATVMRRMAYTSRVLTSVLDFTRPSLLRIRRMMGTSKVTPKANIMAEQKTTNL